LAQTRAGSKSFLSVFSVRFSPVTTVGLTDMSKHQDKSVAANSWASISGGQVRQAGARDLWDEAVTAYQWWTRHDRPDRQQFHLTVTRERQWVWLNDPANTVTTLG
jgi:hypothetical protein